MDINQQTHYGKSSFHYACHNMGCSVEFTKYLIELKADTNLPDADGKKKKK